MTLVLASLLILEWRSFDNVEETASLVHRTLGTERDLTAFGSAIADAETSQRGFLLTGVRKYLSPFEAAARSAPVLLARLRVPLADNPYAMSRIARLDTLSAAKILELRTTLKLADEGDRDSALEVVRTNVGDSLMTSIRTELRELVRNQNSVLNSSESALEAAFEARNLVSLALTAMLAVVLAGVAFMLRRLKRYQDLVTLCAWSRTVSYEGEWLSFEEYLRRRFNLSTTHGISPEALASLDADIAKHT